MFFFPSQVTFLVKDPEYKSEHQSGAAYKDPDRIRERPGHIPNLNGGSFRGGRDFMTTQP